jgi:hypothetical protein
MRRINKLFTNGQPPEDIEERNEEWNTWCDEHERLLDEVEEYFWKRYEDLETALLEHINRTNIGVC